MSWSRENLAVITRKQDRKIIIMHGRLELPYVMHLVNKIINMNEQNIW